MSNSNAGGSTLPKDPMLQRVDATAIAEAKAPSVASANPNRFMNTTQLGSGLGIGPTMNLSMNPLFLQQEMIRRQELERTLGGTAPIAGLAYGLNGLDAIRRREEYLLQLRNNQIIEAELVARFARDQFAERFQAQIPQPHRQRALEFASQTPTTHGSLSSEVSRLSTNERDRLSEVADQTYRTALAANRLPPDGENIKEGVGNIGQKDLGHKAQIHDNVQRRLMDQEAITEQNISRIHLLGEAAALRSQTLVGENNCDLERAQLIQRQQQEGSLRLLQMQHNLHPSRPLTQQLQLAGMDPLMLQSRMRGAMAAGATLPQIHHQTGAPMIDPQVVSGYANMEKVYNTPGNEESHIISKFLNVIASGVPEIMDLLACFFPGGLMDSPEKFRAGFPGVVETTMSHLKIIQDRALKENGLKSRELYDRVSKCIIALGPFTNMAGAQGSSSTHQSSKPPAITAKTGELGALETWSCHKCGNDNKATKSRCSSCQGWKGGVRENKPKKRKPKTDESAAKTKQEKKKKTTDCDKSSKKESAPKPKHILCSAESPSKPKHGP